MKESYSPQAARKAIQTKGLQVIQVPFNIFDRRFEEAGIFNLARQKKKEIYIRSVFLQGLLLLNPDDLPKLVRPARSIIIKFRDLAEKLGLSPRELALAYVRTKRPLDKVILGVDTSKQLEENCKIWKLKIPSSVLDLVEEKLQKIDKKIINPTLWKKT
ncbi:MAG: aldo/keto reductase [Patescibacteria group bacterium]